MHGIKKWMFSSELRGEVTSGHSANFLHLPMAFAVRCFWRLWCSASGGVAAATRSLFVEAGMVTECGFQAASYINENYSTARDCVSGAVGHLRCVAALWLVRGGVRQLVVSRH